MDNIAAIMIVIARQGISTALSEDKGTMGVIEVVALNRRRPAPANYLGLCWLASTKAFCTAWPDYSSSKNAVLTVGL